MSLLIFMAYTKLNFSKKVTRFDNYLSPITPARQDTRATTTIRASAPYLVR
ncbi:hypothetical protein HMPREF0495_00968 [Levilactobacillus brevis ATCC 14869 = DSM 20054]|uniref:Uncharacterized protein n=1 Tax=Levilactobacillus brevis ATCC 14869 = DSM 20054 TaxID=649758 RepID=U2PKL7_LEVBR|nr:hypothetical protein HMPREF0495_00968 [Levilactobacillus brevis ATCC 14869 = DSM 20054]